MHWQNVQLLVQFVVSFIITLVLNYNQTQPYIFFVYTFQHCVTFQHHQMSIRHILVIFECIFSLRIIHLHSNTQGVVTRNMG